MTYRTYSIDWYPYPTQNAMPDINNLLAHKFLVAVYEHEAPFSPPTAKNRK
jgi:hypothetical protein